MKNLGLKSAVNGPNYQLNCFKSVAQLESTERNSWLLLISTPVEKEVV